MTISSPGRTDGEAGRSGWRRSFVIRPRGDGGDGRAGRGLRRFDTRYSRFVILMKLALPLVAILLIGLIVAWPQLLGRDAGFRLSYANVQPEEAEKLRMAKARYVGTDDQNRPYRIAAEQAIQPTPESEHVNLKGPTADMTLADGTWLALTAEEGVYRQKIRRLDLAGSVNLFHDSGYEFRTASAQIDFGAGVASSDTPVEAQGPGGVLKAKGFRMLDKGARVLFTGKAHLVLHPGAGTKGKAVSR